MMKNPSKSQVGLKKLPKDVRNKMGYFADGGNVERNGVLKEVMPKEETPSTNMENSGHSRGGGAAISGTKFVGVR
jgi:hypothetical protein